jgi:hypothetical protein
MCAVHSRDEVETNRLLAGEIPLGILTTTASDYPVTYADFEPFERFEDYRHLFDEFSQSIREGGARRASALNALDALDLGLEFAPGRVEKIIFVIIEGTKARWRLGALRSVRRNQELAFWSQLGPEVGPEACRHPGCSRLRIFCSVFCRRHHFLAIEHREYTGPEDI